jgi:hypothetical protein
VGLPPKHFESDDVLSVPILVYGWRTNALMNVSYSIHPLLFLRFEEKSLAI